MKNFKLEKWANAELKKIQKILLLQHFTIQPVEYNEKEPTSSECEFKHPYLDISIRYSKYVVEDFNKGNLKSCREVLVHEMVHALTDPMYGAGFDRFITKDSYHNEREKLTDHIANVLIHNGLV